MTIFNNMKTNGALCEGVEPRRPRVAAALLERSGKARGPVVCALSAARSARRLLTSSTNVDQLPIGASDEHVRPCERCER